MKKIILNSFIFLVFFTHNIESNSNQNSTQDHSIIFEKDLFKCRLFKKCFIDALIIRNISLEQLVINSTDVNIFKFSNISLCSFTKCPTPSDFLRKLNLNKTEEFDVFRIEIIPVLIGKASLELNTSSQQQIAHVNITIIQPRRIIDIIFDIAIYSFGFIISLLMGILLDKECIVKLFKMPKPMFIGFFCQYIIMPMLAFSICNIFHLTPLESLALFIYGCSPGGAGSNNWTILFNGDLDLSAVLTFVSVLSSMVMMPLWIYTLGRVFSTKAQIKIPILGLFANLMITIVPCLIGLAINLRFPKFKKYALKIAKPFTLVFLITFLVLAFIAKFYSFKLLKMRHWLSGPLIPWCGYLLGGTIAWILGLPFNQVKTVAIETGIQNVGVAFLIIFTNLPTPDADYAALPIVGVATLTNIPLYFALLISKIYSYIFGKSKENSSGENKMEEGPENDPMLTNKE
ncbi:unnamed protein product [Brachionus calyciflorus]|uniref:Uncharacterized protein n=1 Tax=Brachionus calyciflorus TaxID=104777 RepID=A0A814C0D7_9BILA|nr:unnamed protein product [Brachionus calyciflorus]